GLDRSRPGLRRRQCDRLPEGLEDGMTCAVEVARGVEVPVHGFEQCSDGVDDRRLERTIARDTLADLAAASQRFRHGQGPGQGRAYAGIAELAAFPGLRRVG